MCWGGWVGVLVQRSRMWVISGDCMFGLFVNVIMAGCSMVIQSYMSKAKGKEKKNENNSAEQELIEQQKRQILEQTFTIKRLQDRLSIMTEEHHHISTTHDKMQQEYEERIDKQRIIIESHENNIKENRLKIYDLEVNKMTLENRIKDLEREMKEQEGIKNREFDDYRRITQNEILKFESQLKEYNLYMGERDEISHQNLTLKEAVERQKEDKTKELADKEREKVQAIDRLRDEMLTKIKDMRSNLLSLKKEQLDTTTRLAVLQNHQLTSQLEFQSKQSEKLIFENEQLLKKVSHLTKDLEIHKEIEEQLAKRSHYSRGIIKKLTAKISDLEESLKERGEREDSGAKGLGAEDQESKKEEIIRTLDKSLETSEKKYIKLQSETDLVRGEIKIVKNKLQHYETKMNGLLEILFKAYSDFQEDQLQAKEGGYEIDLKTIRQKDIQLWSKDELRMVVNALLQQIGSLLNRKNLGLPPPYRPEEGSILDTDDLINNVKLPKISEHSTNSKLELSLKLRELPVSMGSKLVGSQVRDWGRTVHSSSQANLVRRYKLHENK